MLVSDGGDGHGEEMYLLVRVPAALEAVAGERFDEQHRAIGAQHVARVPRGGKGVAHVVQGVEEGVAMARKAAVLAYGGAV